MAVHAAEEPPPPDDPVGLAGLRQVLAIGAVRSTLATMFVWYVAAIGLSVTLGVQVYDATRRPRDLGLLGLAEFLPTAALVLVTGQLADRHDRRRIATLALCGEIAVAIVLAVIASGHPRSAWPFLAVAFAFGTLRAFSAPAMRSLVPASAPPHLLPRVVAVSSASWQLAIIVGPVLASFVYKLSHPLAFVLAAALFLVALAFTRAIPAAIGTAHLGNDSDAPVSWGAAAKGLSTLRANPILLGAISLDLFAVLFGGAVALLPAVAKDVLHGDSATVGLLRAVGGLGAALVTVRLAVHPLRRSIGTWLMGSVAVFGAATVVFGLSRNLVLSAFALFALNAADSVSVFVRGTLVPLVTPVAERGRVLAVEAVFIGASNELGAFESGELAQHVGVVRSIVAGGVATLVVVALWWILFAPLARVDRFEDVMPGTTAR